MMTGLAVRMSIDLGLHLVSMRPDPRHAGLASSAGLASPASRTFHVASATLTAESTRELKYFARRTPAEPPSVLVGPAYGLRPRLRCRSINDI
jgi:hypothetical protein